MFTNKPMIIYFVLMNDEVVYIGQTKLSLEKRRAQHEYNAKRGKGYIIGSGIRKHGADKFTWNIHSMYFHQRDLDSAEKHLIAKYKPKYNINLGGEARGQRKASGKPSWNKGAQGLQKAWNKGRKEDRIEVLNNIKESANNRISTLTMSVAHKEKIQEGRRRKYRETKKAFLCHQNNKTYALVVDAAKDLGISANGIYAVLNPNHKLKSYKGFTFSYIQHVRAV